MKYAMVKIGQLFCLGFSALSEARQKLPAAVKQMLEAGSGSHVSAAEARDALWCIGSNFKVGRIEAKIAKYWAGPQRSAGRHEAEPELTHIYFKPVQTE